MIPREHTARRSNNVTNLDDARKAKAKAKALAVMDSAKASSAQAQTKENNPHGNRRFDAKKVARIKAAIAAGEYKVDPERVADRFIEHDRNQ